MSDSPLNEAERYVQPRFIKSLIFHAILIALPVMLFATWLRGAREPLDLAPATASLVYAPVAVDCAAPVRCTAWTVDSDDPRVAGLSGLAIVGDRLLALSDSGMLVMLDPPGTPSARVRVRALPVVAGNPRSKIGRDSEALARDPSGDWWVAFEQDHALIRYDRDFRQAIERRPVSDPSFRPNRGVEGLVIEGGRPRWFAEASGVSDAARLPDGRLALLERGAGLTGFSPRVVGLGAPIVLPLAVEDNAEGIAAAARPDGGTRLWIVTDNDGSRWRRTKLLAVDLPPPPRR